MHNDILSSKELCDVYNNRGYLTMDDLYTNFGNVPEVKSWLDAGIKVAFINDKIAIVAGDTVYEVEPIEKKAIQENYSQPWWISSIDYEKLFPEEYYQIRQYPFYPNSANCLDIYNDKPSRFDDITKPKFDFMDSVEQMEVGASADNFDFRSNQPAETKDFYENNYYTSTLEKDSPWFMYKKVTQQPAFFSEIIKNLKEKNFNVLSALNKKPVTNVTKKPVSMPAPAGRAQNYPMNSGSAPHMASIGDLYIRREIPITSGIKEHVYMTSSLVDDIYIRSYYIGDNYPITRYHDTVNDSDKLKTILGPLQDRTDAYSVWLEAPGSGFTPSFSADMTPTMYDSQQGEKYASANTAENDLDILDTGLARGLSDYLFDKDQLEKGIIVEYEHTNRKDVAKEIAKDHLIEIDDYYDRLETMEESAPKREADLYISKGLSVISKIHKREDGWYVLSEKGKNLGGPYTSRKAAEERLREVEYFKHKK